jgi:hypothetical protein
MRRLRAEQPHRLQYLLPLEHAKAIVHYVRANGANTLDNANLQRQQGLKQLRSANLAWSRLVGQVLPANCTICRQNCEAAIFEAVTGLGDAILFGATDEEVTEVVDKHITMYRIVKGPVAYVDMRALRMVLMLYVLHGRDARNDPQTFYETAETLGQFIDTCLYG